MIAASALAGMLWVAGLLPGLSTVDRIGVNTTVGVSTGLSLAGSHGVTYARRSPAMLSFEVGLVHPHVPWLELAPGILLEVEGRVALGLQAQARMYLTSTRFRPYAVVGVPAFVVPFTLLGAKAGGGVLARLHDRFGIALEVGATVFFLGDDLMPRSALAKLDATLALRANF